jgi:hypothetical protein
MAAPLEQDRISEVSTELQRQRGNVSATARALGTSRRSVQRVLQKLGKTVEDFAPEQGRASLPKRFDFDLPAAGAVRRYLLTCAQSNTHIHQPTWRSLTKLADHYGAQILVSRFTYQKEAYGKKSVKPGKTATVEDRADLWFAPEVEPYTWDDPAILAPGLVWCAEMNISPSAVRPLSGLESYTGRKSGIFPHVKVAMESIASNKNEPTKFNYTTGTVTLRNYIAKKAGMKAEFHHSFGALLVEVDHEGSWWCRHVLADSEGTMHDLDVRVKNGQVSSGNRVEAINWGDQHCGSEPDEVIEACFQGRDNMLDSLRPRYQFFHDVLDFRSQNHHDRGDFHKRFKKYLTGRDSVTAELDGVAGFLGGRARRAWCKTVVVDSNHDNALARWLREADYRQDPKNAIFFLEAQIEVLKSLQPTYLGDFHLVEWAIRKRMGDAMPAKKETHFLRPDESFIICHDANGGIECGMHGHLGPNGARGSAAAFSRMGRKSNVGHSHSAGIHDGVYVAGVLGALDQGYNKGPSSWSHSNIVTYPNGKRAIVTIWEGKWRA